MKQEDLTRLNRAISEIAVIYGVDPLTDFSDEDLATAIFYFSVDFEQETPGSLMSLLTDYRKKFK